jgi:hypothetical protein
MPVASRPRGSGVRFEVSFEGRVCVLAWRVQDRSDRVIGSGEVRGSGYGLNGLAAAIAGARGLGVEGLEIFVPGEVELDGK